MPGRSHCGLIGKVGRDGQPFFAGSNYRLKASSTDIDGLGAALYRTASGVAPLNAMDRSRSLMTAYCADKLGQ